MVNMSTRNNDTCSPFEKVCGVKPKVHRHLPFGCAVTILRQTPHAKLEPRAKAGMYLGQSCLGIQAGICV